MKNRLFKYLAKIDNWLYLILIFCLFGVIRNLLLLRYYGLNYSYLTTKVCLAMLLVYSVQILLILLRQRLVWVVSLIQAIFCLTVYKDFTFIPLAAVLVMLKNALFTDISYGWEYFFNFALMSFMFCLELIKTYLLYALTDQYKPKN